MCSGRPPARQPQPGAVNWRSPDRWNSPDAFTGFAVVLRRRAGGRVLQGTLFHPRGLPKKPAVAQVADHDEHSYAEPQKVAIADLALDIAVDFDAKTIGGTAT